MASIRGMTAADAFEAFVRAHQDRVFAIALRLLGNPAEAEDVAQTVFLKAFERFETIGASPTAAGWLNAVATNACLNHLTRYRARWRPFSDFSPPEADDGDSAFEDRLVSGDSPADRLEDADRVESLERALHELPDHQRVPIVLYHFENASYQEIATMLRISVAKVKTDIHRGRVALRKQLTAGHVIHRA